MKKVILIIIIALSLVLYGCGSNTTNNNQINISDSSYYKRDNEFIKMHLFEFIRTKRGGFYFGPQYETYRIKNLIIPVVDTIYYSPNRLKLISIIVLKLPVISSDITTYNEDNKIGYTFYGRIIAGIRESLKQKWLIEDFIAFSTSKMNSYSRAVEPIMKFLFGSETESIKQSGTMVYDGDEWMIKAYYRWNMNDPEFWDDSNIVWKKGLGGPVPRFGYKDMKGMGGPPLYIFQTIGLSRPALTPNEIKPRLDIALPDSLQKMFDDEQPPVINRK